MKGQLERPRERGRVGGRDGVKEYRVEKEREKDQGREREKKSKGERENKSVRENGLFL